MATDTQDPQFAHQGAADSESYVLRGKVSTPAPDRSKSVREHLTNVTVGPGVPPSHDEAGPSPVPQLTPEAIAANYAKLKYPVLVSEWVNENGVILRSYKEDKRVAGDGLRDASGTDRGEGTRESLKILAKEGAINVTGLLDSGRARTSGGQFAKRGKS